jgi:mRNA m6A methyltransferase catalytic subunit
MAKRANANGATARDATEDVLRTTAALVDGDEDARLESWRAASEDDLNALVLAYRDAARALKSSLEARGACALGDDTVEYDDSLGRLATLDGSGASADAASADVNEEELGNVDDIDPREWRVPPQCIPVHANVTTYDWRRMYEHEQFDVIMMDPPWQLATANPTRGVSLGYSQLTDQHIADLPLPQLQRDGLLFVWVINAKYQWCLNQFKKWGYEFVDEIVWVKVTNSRRLAKSHGFYLQHAKEVCLVARRGDAPLGLKNGGKAIGSDIIFAPRRGQSQKPTEIYELIEELVPNGKYLEIFARKNNLRDYWVSVGNEVTGTGLPPDDVKAFEEKGAVPAAKYGAGNR